MEEETELDPRIQVELEKLNSATDEINKLEIEVDVSTNTLEIDLCSSCLWLLVTFMEYKYPARLCWHTML